LLLAASVHGELGGAASHVGMDETYGFTEVLASVAKERVSGL
jgi:hypothetical protein